MNIAIVGTGISGMTCGWLLHRQHEITLFEANEYVGGHTHTVDVPLDDRTIAVDTGFIVFNDRTYPNFLRLLDELAVASQDTTMSFSVSCERTGLEYNGHDLNTLFAQRRNLFSWSFLRMIREIVRFNRCAPRILDAEGSEETLQEYLDANGYSQEFRENYIIPMAASIWSAEHEQMGCMPVRFFVRFFKNHGLLSITNRPQWKVIQGGSRTYAEKLVTPFRDRVRLSCPVVSVRRHENHAELRLCDGARQRFDAVILATHSDQALALLEDPSDEERRVLESIPYQENEAVLHTDESILPRNRRAWAAWNYHRPAQTQARVAVSYNMNLLQGLNTPQIYCVTLNHSEKIRPERIIARMVYHHPVFTLASLGAQRQWSLINGVRRTWYCGAYWGYGFHEDGVNSAIRVAEAFQKSGTGG